LVGGSFANDAEIVAPQLLGALLTSTINDRRVTVRITEVEAYLGFQRDPASHAYRGRTERNAVMFGQPGHFYVYFTYGMHWCLNVVTGPPATAVLIRAGEVIDGVAVAESRRPKARRSRDLARGPANLAAALGVDGAFNGLPIDSHRLSLVLDAPLDSALISTGPRVGISVAVAAPLRFWITDDETVSAYKPGKPRRGSTDAP
jgi:DNA-3-methyladenine glycosylase